LPKRLLEQAEFCDWVLLIAPESDACLLRCCQWIEPLDHKLISPDLQFVRLAADKQLTLEHLARSHIPVPPGGRLSELSTHQSAIGLPAVVKPIDGAGSERVQLIENWAAIEDLGHWDNWRVESYVPGYAVSVSVLCGNQQFKLLPPTGQQFDREPFGNYIGSIYPLPAVIADRASELAARVMRAMPITRGYLGIDLVVPDPKDYPDLPAVVIEVNPRLTMSYIRLSQILGPAVARAMLELATTGRITTP
jgi:predicted ATP-grasp superfamily ATP-dependent carboligase